MRTKLIVLAIILAGLAGKAQAQAPQTLPAASPRLAEIARAFQSAAPDFVVPKPQGAPAPQPPSGQPAATESYAIGPQDNLSIIVTDETDLTGKYRVDTDGTISMPFLQRVPVAGLTL